MPTTEIDLNKDTKEHFGIKQVHKYCHGGQKMVFIVSREDDKKYAMKLFKDYGAREIRELGIYKDFEHIVGIPKVVEVSDFSGDKVVFENFIEGSNLSEVKDNYLGNGEKISGLLKGIIGILDEIWKAKIIHRDLKPDNIIINSEGVPHIIDFGIARDLDSETITDTGFQPKTTQFCSPEQIQGKKELITYRTDYFSLGVIAYYLYFGQLPFGNTKEEIVNKINSGDLSLNIDTSCGLSNFLSMTLQFSPSNRPRNSEILLSLI